MTTQTLGRHARPEEPAHELQRPERAGSSPTSVEATHRAGTPSRAIAVAAVVVVALGLAALRLAPANATRDRLRPSRGIKTLVTGQRFFGGFEALHALRRGHARLASLVPGYDATNASVHARVRAVACAVTALGARRCTVAAPTA